MIKNPATLVSELLFLVLSTLLLAQSAWADAPDGAQGDRWLDVEVGQSLVERGDSAIARVLISDPGVAEVKLLEEQQIQIRGVQVGTTDLWVWYREQPAKPVTYEVNVHVDLAELERRVAAAVSGEAPKAYPMKGRLVLDGPVPDVETLERVAAIARVYDPDFVNLLSVPGDHQVQLHVVFAEVSRTGVREMGFNGMLLGDGFQTGWYGPNYGDGVSYSGAAGLIDTVFPTTGAFQVMGAAVIDDLLLGAFLGALEQNNLSKVLAEPTLVALSGQEAKFLSGGRVPIAISTYDNIRIEFEEYGIKLVFVPTVLADEVIDLRVYVEVSELDTANAIQVGGLGIPGFISRQGSSHLRVRDGMTFAMAGLLSENTRHNRSELPLLGRIPLIGALFRYVEHEREETEIVIFVTPRLVRPMSADEVPPLPTAFEDNNPSDLRLFLLGSDRRADDRQPEVGGPVGMERSL
jgi:pilus assembly protein CpaC